MRAWSAEPGVGAADSWAVSWADREVVKMRSMDVPLSWSRPLVGDDSNWLKEYTAAGAVAPAGSCATWRYLVTRTPGTSTSVIPAPGLIATTLLASVIVILSHLVSPAGTRSG